MLILLVAFANKLGGFPFVQRLDQLVAEHPDGNDRQEVGRGVQVDVLEPGHRNAQQSAQVDAAQVAVGIDGLFFLKTPGVQLGEKTLETWVYILVYL